MFLFAVFLAFAGAANAQVTWGVTINGPGYYGSINTAPQYRNDYPRYQHNHVYRPYVMPPRFQEPTYKDYNYYQYRNSCFNYPVYDYRGMVIGYRLRCM